MRRLLSVFRALILSRRPVTLVVWGYALYILVGFGLLCLPWAHARPGVPALDSLFVATSAVSTTGLSTIGVADSYNFFGELVIAALIQLGGIGYMTLGSFVMLALRQRLDTCIPAWPSRPSPCRRAPNVAQFIRGVVIFTVVIESDRRGCADLAGYSRRDGVPAPRCGTVSSTPFPAFCTAGFSLFGDGLEGFRDKRDREPRDRRFELSRRDRLHRDERLVALADSARTPGLAHVAPDPARDRLYWPLLGTLTTVPDRPHARSKLAAVESACWRRSSR